MSLAASLGRMSRRERLLVGLLIALLFGSVIFVFNFIVGTEVSSLEKQIGDDRETLKKIYAKSGAFLKATAATEAMRQRPCSRGAGMCECSTTCSSEPTNSDCSSASPRCEVSVSTWPPRK